MSDASMFKQRTLFIVGAGASFEAGIPVGLDLAKNIAVLLNATPGLADHPGNILLRQLYDKFPQGNNKFDHAARAISTGVRLTNSIDDFLDRRSDDPHIQRVGRAAIVRMILAAEAQSHFLVNRSGTGFNLEEIENTWFVKFFRMLGAEIGSRDIEHIFDNVAFVVFNYDRCIEFFLYHALQRVYGISDNTARALVAKCCIIHPYGRIAPLDFQGQNGVPFGSTWDHDCATLSENVRIYTEQLTDKKMLQDISDEIAQAKQFVFLGFGYNLPNMRLLTPQAKTRVKPVFGTALGLSAPSIRSIQAQIAQLLFESANVVQLEAIQLTDLKCNALFDFHARRLPN